jgi:ABC-type dipeptide/oligopeptide/nickel transport system permease subunit
MGERAEVVERIEKLKPGLGVRFKTFAREFFSIRLTGVGIFILLVVILCAIFAEVISPYDPNEQDYSVLSQPPSRAHWVGTDPLGRDILSRIIYGTRVSLQVGIIAIVIAVGVGLPIGLISGFVGGAIDNILMRIIDSIQSFPYLILALGISAALGPSKGNAMIAIGFVSVPAFARLARGETLRLRESEFVAAARILGFPTWKIILKNILPNGSGPIIVQATLRIATAIITESSLSYLGVGVQPPTPSWGTMLRSGTQYLSSTPWLAIAPGFAIFLTVLAINFIGDGLRHALDPRLVMRQRG